MLPFSTSLSSVQGHSTPKEKHMYFIIFKGKTQAGGDFSKKREVAKCRDFPCGYCAFR